MLPTYDVYITETSGDCLEKDLLKRFIVTYLTQDDLDKLKVYSSLSFFCVLSKSEICSKVSSI